MKWLNVEAYRSISNSDDIETKANENFDNGVFFLCRIEANAFDNSKIFSKRSEYVHIEKLKYRSDAKSVNIKL